MSTTTMDTSFGTRLRASLSPRLLLSELLLKQWFEPVIPFTVMIGLLVWFSLTIPNYAGMQNLLSLMRLYAEFGFVALGMAFCLITGGIDLSVGAIFALCNFAALFFLNVARTADLDRRAGHGRGRRCDRRHQRPADRLSEGTPVSHHPGHPHHPARVGQYPEREIRHRLRDQLGG